MSFDKKNFRKDSIEIRAGISEKDLKSQAVYSNLLLCRYYIEADKVFIYASSENEVCTNEICKHAEENGKRTAFPVCTDKNGNMEFYFESRSNLKKGMYGISEPDTDSAEKAFFDEKTLCIVPGVAFDKNGGRVGYGKGYYDRFLSNFTGKSIGLCFEECFFKAVPTDKHDKNVNCVITDKKIYFTAEEE